MKKSNNQKKTNRGTIIETNHKQIEIRTADERDLEFILKLTRQKNNVHAKEFFEKNKFKLSEETKSGILIERKIVR